MHWGTESNYGDYVAMLSEIFVQYTDPVMYGRAGLGTQSAT